MGNAAEDLKSISDAASELINTIELLTAIDMNDGSVLFVDDAVHTRLKNMILVRDTEAGERVLPNDDLRIGRMHLRPNGCL